LAAVREDGRVTQYGYPNAGQPSGPPYPGLPQSAPPAGYAPPQSGYAVPQPGYGAGGPGLGGPGAVAPNGAPLPDFGTRFVARLIDSAILGAVGAVFMVILFIGFFFVMSRAITVNDDGTSDFSPSAIVMFVLLVGAFVVALFVVQYVYEVEYSLRTGQTVGKRVMKLKIVPLDPTRQLTRGALVKRWLVQVGASFVPGLGLVDGLWQLWDQPYKQCLHDKGAKTLVVKLPT
jgi:uncharacterized RDD family membrane protein YckC